MKAKRVLICEDDRLVQRTLKVLIEREGGEVIQAFEGGEAMELMDLKQFDMVIMDIHLPFSSGLELIGHLRNDLQMQIPIVVLTALSDRHIQDQAFQLGADHYLIKPVDPDRLMRLIKNVSQ
jgi:DNA-binding response OmpR family regulator